MMSNNQQSSSLTNFVFLCDQISWEPREEKWNRHFKHFKKMGTKINIIDTSQLPIRTREMQNIYHQYVVVVGGGW